MQKAFSTLLIKSFDDDAGIIRGIASTPATDRAGDIVEPIGAVFKLPIPLLFNHDHAQPIGHVTEATVTSAGIEIVARVVKSATERVAEVWKLIKAGLVTGLSVGFTPIEAEPIPGGLKFSKWSWLELSAVTVPANPEASINFVKGKHSMTIAQQIASFEAKRQEAHTRMTGIMTKAADEGRVLDEAETKAYDAAQAEVGQFEAHIGRLKALEIDLAKSAQPVAMPHIEVKNNAPKGTDFIRFTKALALSRGNPMAAAEIAKGMNMGNRVETCLKAAVAAGTTTSADFTALVEPKLMASEFVDLLRPALIVSKMTQVRNVPQNIRLPRATTGTTASWVGEGKAAPVTNAAFGDLEVGAHKLGAIAVFTEELLRNSEPSAEALVRDELIATLAQAVDVAFIDQSNAGIAGVKPASIVNGATTAAASGTDAAAVRNDVKAAYGVFVSANQPLNSGVWVMHPQTALALAQMTNATTGLREFPGVDFVTGGTFEGLPVVISTIVPDDGLGGYDVVLAVQSEILLAEGGLAIDASREASLEMESAPTGDAGAPTAASLVSLWQTGAVAIKAIRGITWTKRRPTAVYRISGAKYA